MKKTAALLMMLLFFHAGCSSPGIRQTESTIDKAKMYQSFRMINIDFKVLWESYFNFLIKKTEEGIIENPNISLDEKKKTVALLKSMKFVENQIFLYRIRHLKAVHREKGGMKFTFTDARGGNLVTGTLDTTLKHSGDGTFYEQCFLFLLNRPVTKKNFTEAQSPLKFTVQYIDGTREVYLVTPN